MTTLKFADSAVEKDVRLDHYRAWFIDNKIQYYIESNYYNQYFLFFPAADDAVAFKLKFGL